MKAVWVISLTARDGRGGRQMKAVWVISLTARDGRGGRKEPGGQTDRADGYLSALALDPTAIHPVEVKESVQFSAPSPRPHPPSLSAPTPSQPARPLASRLCQLLPSPRNQPVSGLPSPRNQPVSGLPSPHNQPASGLPSARNQHASCLPSPRNQHASGLPSPRNQPVLVRAVVVVTHSSNPQPIVIKCCGIS